MKTQKEQETLIAKMDAIAEVTASRNAAYGDPEDDFKRVARMKEGLTGMDDPVLRHVAEMILVKLSRIVQTPSHHDSWLDIVGYARTAAVVIDRRERLASDDSSNSDSTGLGLTVSRQLIQLMGGRIEVRSEPGKGSCFRIDLRLARAEGAPVRSVAQNAGAEVRPAKLPHFTGRVLVAEDNPVNQTVTSRMLEQLGLRVCLVPDGQAALAHWQKESFDLIFMDLRMPRLDGHATCRAIREQEAGTGRRIPIIALTANAQAADREQCLAAGMDDFISKPFDRDTLIRHLETWLGMSGMPGPETSADAMPSGAGRQETGPGADEVLQTDMLQQLEEEMGDEFGLLVATFIESVDTQLADMQGILQDGDRETFTRLAHNLKSSSRVLGAVRLSELAARLEERGRGHDASTQIAGEFEALQACYGEVRSLLQARIASSLRTG